ncbi:unnamed protein product [Thlaspi arvense]|uniref:F-box domain-containing protein n=1 Tax=Thlaspi arvense TaxID=13288 RepID=A0AAU9SVB0_THLAR|nr:unnamed protein product [Thlaspi arvense]
MLRLNAILEKFRKAEVKNEIANKGFYLPMELLLVILSRLSLKDNVRASSVCKAWHDAAVSVRSNSPWLVYFNTTPTGVSYGFYDPMEKKKTQSMKLPNEPFYTRLFYSKDGWLLLSVYYHKAEPPRLVFFNPFTQAHIILPSIKTSRADFAFSCAPTNESCVVCCISNRTRHRFLIHTWYHGAAEWVTELLHIPLLSRFRGRNDIMFSDGCFWLEDRHGRLRLFDPVARTWDTLSVPKVLPFLMCTTEHKGNIFRVSFFYESNQKRLVLFRLDRSMLVWEKMETFDGLSIFVSNNSSIVTNGLAGDMCNIVHEWNSHLDPYRLFKHSLCTGSLCTDKDDPGLDSSTNGEVLRSAVWIEPPHRS